jgi:hypothetical protein
VGVSPEKAPHLKRRSPFVVSGHSWIEGRKGAIRIEFEQLRMKRPLLELLIRIPFIAIS